MKRMLLLSATLLLSACKAPPPVPPAEAPGAAASAQTAVSAPAPLPSAKPIGKADFADKVWKVSASNAVQAGSTYAFLWNGTLVVDSPAATPMYGSWSYDDGKLTMTEEGQAYPTRIVHVDATTLQIRSENPGESVDISLVLAPDLPLPPAEPVAAPATAPTEPTAATAPAG